MAPAAVNPGAPVRRYPYQHEEVSADAADTSRDRSLPRPAHEGLTDWAPQVSWDWIIWGSLSK